jgi:hypothetical protein
MECCKCLIKSLKKELWNFVVDAHAHCTHCIVDRSINISLLTGCLLAKACSEHDVLWTWRFVDLACDTVLTNWQTEKLNFDTNYVTILVKPGFHMVVTVVKRESQSFSTAKIQQFRTENSGRVIINREYLIYIWFTGRNSYNLAVEKDCDSIFTTI